MAQIDTMDLLVSLVKDLTVSVERSNAASNENFEHVRKTSQDINNNLGKVSGRMELLAQEFKHHKEDSLDRFDQNVLQFRRVDNELKEVKEDVTNKVEITNQDLAAKLTLMAAAHQVEHSKIGDRLNEIEPTVKTTKTIYSLILRVLVPLVFVGSLVGGVLIGYGKH
jgi:archaellum component FlaC